MPDTPIIDIHHHLDPDPAYADHLAERCARLNIRKVCVMGIEPGGHLGALGGNSEVEAAFRKYPEVIVGFGHVVLGQDGPDKVTELKQRGFTGLKFIVPPKAYNDEAFFPIYERAEALSMPALFHLGIVARMEQGHHVRVDCGLMRPIHLDSLARTFPDWTIIGAHFGNPSYDEAAMAARWNPNLYFDLSGSTLKAKRPESICELLWWDSTTRYGSPDGRGAWEKILFGSDVDFFEIKDVLHDYEVLMKVANLSPELRYAVRYGTAARILGLEG